MRRRCSASFEALPCESRAFRTQRSKPSGRLSARAHETRPSVIWLSERAANYAAQGKKGMARKDLERILAEDSTFEGVQERIAALSD